jgi:hypothetical protein
MQLDFFAFFPKNLSFVIGFDNVIMLELKHM